jgi:iron complex outermembrane recepter protein
MKLKFSQSPRLSSHCSCAPQWIVALLIAAPSASIGINAAMAQTAPQAPATGQALDEIVVTARYRSEDLQRVPISVSAITAQDIQERGLTSVVDFAKGQPNVVMTSVGQQGGQTIGVIIRGVGQTSYSFGLQPGVGLYIDDVYLSTLYGSQFGLLDVNNVEILRGPQGTLSGRNSEGGAVKIYSTQPKGDDSGYAELGYGNYAHTRFLAAYDFSLIPDRLFLRVSGGIDEHQGYTTSIDYACSHPASQALIQVQTTQPGCVLGKEGGDNGRSFRANLRALISDSLEVNLSADFFSDDTEPAADKTIAIATTYGGSPTIAGLINLAHPGLNYGNSFLTNSLYTNYDTYGDPVKGDAYTGRNYAPENDLDAWGTSAVVDWTTGWNAHLKSITAYREYGGEFTSANTAPYGSVGYTKLTHHQVSEELRLTGEAFQDHLDWAVGAFYFAAGGVEAGEELLSGLGNDFTLDEPSTDENKSVFGHVNYHVTDALSVEAGVRYSEDNESYTFDRYYLLPFFGLPAGTPVVTPRRYATGSTRTDYKVAVDYQWTDAFMTYVEVSTGYKAGGINPQPTSDATVSTFKPEDLRAYEVGAKTEWFDHRLRLNADTFFSDYKNLQLSASQAVPQGFQVLFENVGRVNIYGVESELTARPTPALSLDLNVGWLHYHALDLGTAAYNPVANSGGAILGAPAPFTPSWKGGFGVQYSFPGIVHGSLTPRLDASYQSRVYFDNQETPAASQGAYTLFNAALTWESDDAKWRATLRADNAFNKHYYLSMTNLLNPLGILSGQPSPPRMILLSVRRSFGSH